MFKRIFGSLLLLLALFCFNLKIINAYEFTTNSESQVMEKINEIFDMKEQYEDLVGEYETKEVEIYDATGTSYWWPIGSSEVTEEEGRKMAAGEPVSSTITSLFGLRNDPFGSGKVVSHGGVDISNSLGNGGTNIIAAKDGVVVYPTSIDGNNCPSSSSQSSCGGGYGNHVIIQHNDGNYTLYAHLYENSILVKAGDSVKQGQVIAKMGSSGNSTGTHLHFEVREGSNTSQSRVDPLNYVSKENPRQTSNIVTGESSKQTVCLTLKSSGYNNEAIIAILQNLYNESGINSVNLENKYEKKYGYNDESYTEAVDSGKYNNFVHDSAGYGLAQWTYWSRKQNLLNYAKSKNTSIGDAGMQIDFFINELSNGYAGVNNYLLNLSYSYGEKAYYMCANFERPAGMPASCQKRSTAAAQFVKYVNNGCKD